MTREGRITYDVAHVMGTRNWKHVKFEITVRSGKGTTKTLILRWTARR